MKHDELMELLKRLRLKKMSDEYSEVARICEKKGNSFEQYLHFLSKSECNYRDELRVKRFLKESKLPYLKALDSYKFKGISGITDKEVQRLSEGEFLNNGGNIVFYGSFGLGKTHLAIGLVKKFCEMGKKCLFIQTSRLIEMLLEAQKELNLGATWQRLDRFELIVCDELG